MNVVDKNHFREIVKRSPFHSRIELLCYVNDWSRWKAYTTVNTYEDVELEYFAIRSTCSVFDLSPMSKYRIRGTDALAFLNRLMTRNVSKLKPGRVGYSVWCNDRGKVIDDGTIFHLKDGEYRLCAQERQLDWLMLSALGFDVEIFEETDDIAGLSFQGPTTCAVLKTMELTGIENLKPFGIQTFPFEGGELMVSRTGFTGDLGYELWIDPSRAEALWDTLFDAGQNFGIRPVGGNALEMARVEAGFIQAGVDFMPANETVRAGHDRSPFEIGLDWLVDFKKPIFTGRKALLEEKQKGSRYSLVKLDIEGNKPAKDSFIYTNRGKKQVGKVTSALWSPSCKANIALASLDSKYASGSHNLWAEIYYQRELTWHKKLAQCTIVDKPFWDPPRRRATPPADY